MDSASPVSSFCLFKETRIDLQPLRPHSIIQLQVPSTSTFSVRSRQQRRILREPPTYRDEDEFNKYCLATSSSVFFGKRSRHPRSILWRVLGEGKILELRSGDLSKSNVEEKEASLVIQLCFPTALKQECVAIADTDDSNVVEVFALTKGNELYTLNLRRDFFCYAAASEEDISRWCKVSKPATFSISTPHRLIARNNLQLVISLSDGRLLMLRRQRGEDGSKWYESTYGDGQWTSSLRGLVRWQGSNTIKYEGSTLEQGTPTAIATAPVGNHIFAVCLNHTLRIWNPEKAVSVFSKDLLWQHREPHEIPKVMLDPASPNVLQLFQSDGEVEGDIYYAVTFSPHDLGQFKFWGIRDPDHGSKGVRDVCPDHILKPPDPDPSPESKAIWKVADFRVKGGQARKGMELWVLMRSNRRYKLYNLNFDIPDLGQVWPSDWSYADFESLYDLSPPHVWDLDPLDATDKWLDFILSSGKTPQAVLETALAMYCSERSISLPSTQMSIKERMSTAIAFNVGLSDSSGDFNDYRRATDQEWTMLWQEIRDLNRSRWSIMSLAYDEQLEMPWLTFADGYSTVRTCDKTEILTHNHIECVNEAMSMRETPSIETNTGGEPKLPDELALVIEAAATFRLRFSHGLLYNYTTILREELWQEPSYSVPLRIQSFYDRCDFAEEIGTVPFEELNNALEPIGGFDGLQTATFLAILEDFSYSLPNGSSGLSYTLLGRNGLVNGARELIHLRERILFDLVALVIFVDMEIDRDEMPMEDFDAAQIYPKFLDLLRQYHITRWLVNNERTEDPSGTAKPSDSFSTNGSSPSATASTRATIIESLFARDLSAQSLETQSQSEALTYSIKDLLQWTVGGNDDISLDEMPVFVQTYLLANKNIDLASDFVQYQPSTAWSIYIKGRLHLAKGKFTEAAIYFKKAAFKLCELSSFPQTISRLTTMCSPSLRLRISQRLKLSPQQHGSGLLRQRPPNLLHPHPQPL